MGQFEKSYPSEAKAHIQYVRLMYGLNRLRKNSISQKARKMNRARMTLERSARVSRWFCIPQISLFRLPFEVFPQPVKPLIHSALIGTTKVLPFQNGGSFKTSLIFRANHCSCRSGREVMVLGIPGPRMRGTRGTHSSCLGMQSKTQPFARAQSMSAVKSSGR